MSILRGLRSQYAGAFTSVSYLFLLLFAFQSHSKSAQVILLGIVAAIGFAAWVSTYSRSRAIAELPTSRIGSAAQGYVELYGQASLEREKLATSPISGRSCIWFRCRTYTQDDDSRGGWREISCQVSDTVFEIRDATGICLVDPDHAEVIGADVQTRFANGYKQVEEILFGGVQTYVLGEFSTIGGAHTALSVSEDVSALLAQWKRDPIQLKKRFDLNGDGEVDLKEWELARRLATQTVELQHREIRKESGVHVMRAPRNGRLFLISNLSPHKLRQRYVGWSFFHLGVLLLACAMMFRNL